MSRASIVFAVVGLFFPRISLAQQPVRFGVFDKRAIEQLFDRYVQAFSTKDYAKLREQLQAPFLTFQAGVDVMPTMDDVMNYYGKLRDSLDEQNYARSQYVRSRITAIAADRALVNRTFRRFRKDGTVLLNQSAIYLVSKSSGAWKICGAFAQDLEEFGKVY